MKPKVGSLSKSVKIDKVAKLIRIEEMIQFSNISNMKENITTDFTEMKMIRK